MVSVHRGVIVDHLEPVHVDFVAIRSHMFLVEFLELFVSVNLNDLENCVVLLTLLIIFFRTWASACLTRCTWCEALLASSLLTLDCVIEGTLVVVLPYDYSVGNYTVKILYHS